MKKGEKHLSLRIDEGLLRQFDYVAKYDDRSMNWLLLRLVKDCIKEFEQQHGKIDLGDPEKQQRTQAKHDSGNAESDLLPL